MSVWSVDQVLALAPDASSRAGARSVSRARAWQATGRTDDVSLWGLCQGSGRQPYQTCVDLREPAYHCSCPSRKVPCKHVLGLLLLWVSGEVPVGEPPEWLLRWQNSRAARQTRGQRRAPAAPPSEKTVRRRADRVAAGLDELDRWLSDQVRQGLAGASRAGYRHWATMAARLVDAQAPGVAGAVGRLASVASSPDRLLAELGLLRLLVTGYRRLDELPADLAATVRGRVGFPVAVDDVLAGPPVRDVWQVLAVRDEAEERLTVRRTWLRGRRSARPALVLSFAAPGQELAADLIPGTEIDADLCFYPGAQPLRALVATRYSAAASAVPAGGDSVSEALDGYSAALAVDPWLERWPMLLDGVCPVHAGRWHLVDGKGDGLPVRGDGPQPWRLVAAAGGRPVTVAAEWTVAGLRPLTAWAEDRMVRL
ncbi:MAG TPA: SWIM zinc finger family protein [Micromonosporaceae bacterium]